MTMNLANKNKLHGKLYRSNTFIGSGVPFLSNGRILVATCHHVIFEDGFTEEQHQIKEISFNIGNYILKAIAIVTDFNTSQKGDVLIVEFENDGTTPDLLNLYLLVDVDEAELLTYKPVIITSHPQETQIAHIPLIDRLIKIDEYSIESAVEKGTFFNQNRGRGGAKEYAGVSGSGLFISLNGNIYLLGLLSILPNCSIEEQVIINRLDSLKHQLSDLLNFSVVTAPNVPPSPLAELKDVCFVHYTNRSKYYYYERTCDSILTSVINDNVNIWIHGESGSGKTAMIARNLSDPDFKHIACDLEPVLISSCDSIFRGIIDSIAYYVESEYTPKSLEILELCRFLQGCNFDDNTIITIDEMSCNDPLIIDEFCQKIVRLVRQYEKVEQDKQITFVISSIFHPSKHRENFGKTFESFDFLHVGDWSSLEIESLFDLQNSALGSMICSQGKHVILECSAKLPRLLTKLVQRVYRSNNFSVGSISNTADCVIREFKEYE
ncbi:ATP-binding protein [Enterovibrio norvegicus]|uniref:ATP-binding protein n=1 Tax=Enterovibrio norvegicus TaxID=188144 RepID=UPI00354DB423